MLFTNIYFKASYGDEDRNVIISAPNGAHGGGFNVLVNNYLYGRLFKRNDIWVGFFNEGTDITGADIDVIGNIIDQQMLNDNK
ncbi:MAG: hypothetical protein EOO47_23795 [Flavobacterium sp.]|nr:MAG: hypothetical protein EOO47_23795 [Flavobacterium sp.]